MANVDRVNGAKPVKHLNGSPYNGQANMYFIASGDGTAVAVGDFVKIAGSASADGYPTVIKAAAGDANIGVVVGIVVDPGNLNTPQYRAASTNRYVMVADAPDIVYELQADDVGSTLAVTDVGLNAEFVDAGVNTTTGASGVELDTSTKATTATLGLKIVGIVNRADNEIGVANQRVLVINNKHQFVNQIAGV